MSDPQDHAREIEALRRSADAQAQRALFLEHQLQAVLSSRSWRLTRPLRWLTEKLRALRPFPPTVRDANTDTPDVEAAGAAPPLAENARRVPDPIQARVSVYKTGAPFIEQPVRNVRIYVAAAGNHFFREIAALIQCGFGDIGIPAAVISAETVETCADAALTKADLHLIVAPHEFFHFIPQAVRWPHSHGRVWMLNTEQAHTPWFAGARAHFHLADLVLDMDCGLAGQLGREGILAEHLPLGFSPSCHLFDGTAPVSENIATRGLPKRIREYVAVSPPLAEPLENRPIDCCFFGNSVDRRAVFFARHAALFAKLRAYLRLLPLTVPLRVGINTPLSTQDTSAIVRRSKVALNIHQSHYTYFEWHRIVLQGIWQGALVVSEPCTEAFPFRPNLDYVATDLFAMADTLEYLLFSEDGRALSEKIRCHAYTTLITRCLMGTRLEELLQVYAPVLERPA